MRPPLEFCALFWAPQYKRNMDTLAIKMIKELEHLSYEERLRQLALFSLGKRRLHKDLINIYRHLKGRAQRGHSHAVPSSAQGPG